MCCGAADVERQPPSSRRRFRPSLVPDEQEIRFSSPRFLCDEPDPGVFVHGHTWVELVEYEEPQIHVQGYTYIEEPEPELQEERLHRCIASRLRRFDIGAAIEEALTAA